MLQALGEQGPDPQSFRKLRSATDLELRATENTAQGIGRSMSSLVVLQRHLWLSLTEMRDLEKARLLDAPISPHGLFGDDVGSFSEKFLETQKQSKTLSHFLPKRVAAPPQRYLSSSSRRPYAASSSGLKKDPESAVKPKSRYFRHPTNPNLRLSPNIVPDGTVLRWNLSPVEADNEPPSERVHLAMLHPTVPLLVTGDRAEVEGFECVFPIKFSITIKINRKRVLYKCLKRVVRS